MLPGLVVSSVQGGLTFTFSPSGDIKSPINLTHMHGRKLWREPVQTQGEHTNSTRCRLAARHPRLKIT